MIIKITKTDKNYEAEIKNRDGISIFKTIEPLEKDYLNEVLLNLGFHQRSIFDAFDMADGASVNIPHPFFKPNE